MPSQTTAIFTHDLSFANDLGEVCPEAPRRVEAVLDAILACGLDALCPVVKVDEPASRQDVLRAHDAAYLESLEKLDFTQKAGPVALTTDTWMASQSLEAAMLSAGTVLEATRAVDAGRFANAFCLVRPPGHHAGISRAQGFCLINSIAVAVRYALDVLGMKRVAVIDIDAHHGNGIEEILAEDERVALFSFYEQNLLGATASAASNVAKLALLPGTTGAEVIDKVRVSWVEPIARFAPEMIFVAAGFDAHIEDEMSDLAFTDRDYARLTRLIVETADAVCSGRLVSSLEGGYNARVLARCALAHVRALSRI